MIITFGITAFTATMIASLSQLNGISSTPNIALASSVLLLAPGFSFVNSFLDSLKGYLMMGWGDGWRNFTYYCHIYWNYYCYGYFKYKRMVI